MDWKQALVEYGYGAVAVGCFIEGETVLLLAAIAAQLGYLALPGVLIAAAFGGLSSDQTAFWAGRAFGPRLIARSARLTELHPVVRAWLERHAAWIAFCVRFAIGFRTAVPLLLGASGMTPRRFAALNLLGAALWALAYGSLGFLSGSVVAVFLNETQRNLPVLLVAVVIVLAIFLLTRVLRRQVMRRVHARDGK
jgi:membrane protein DedA with SNARE-associated domain